jgi:cytochrome c-type biogenesis protein CcmF
VIPELGQIALLVALALSVALGTLPLIGAQRGRADWVALARPLTHWFTLAIIVSYACLTSAFVRHDFSVEYVATNSNSALPLAYRIAGVWGGHEGSLLLWMLMLALWMVAVARFSKALPAVFVARILAVMGWVAVGFLLFTLVTSNPFVRLLPPAADGRDLNPLLQDPGMVLHPPMLYMGYVGFSVAFAFAIAALIGGNLDATWARWTRPWTTAAWIFLTIGIALGSWWAYYELGWGGWWFWDPVENASFMPWLVGTALIHSLAVTEKRGGFKAWTVLLAISAFSLSLLGTFLVRSGVLSSVHAFATDPARGGFILAFLVIVIGGSLALYAWRVSKVGLGQRFDPVSRESALLGNNVVLAVATGAVLLGTLYPLFLDALGLGKISVGPPYFDAVFGALMLPLLLLMGIGPLARWKSDAPRELLRRLVTPAGFAVVATIASALYAGKPSFWSIAGMAMGWWIVATVFAELYHRALPQGGTLAQLPSRLAQMPRALNGMLIAHLGVAVFCFGVTLVKTHELERDVQLAPGQSVEVAGTTFTLTGLRDVAGPNYGAVQGDITVTRNGETVTTMHPQKRVYRVQQNPMTEASIRTNLWRDLYVALGEPVDNGRAWIVRIHLKPFVAWIWGGCVIMALGGALAASDRRYRVRQRAPAADAAAAAQAA